uniref:Uncharacterized protein n=1 Tax=Anopheles farauti TaxID=69004 RepID=A0A182Q4A7_9DIPT
MKCWDAGLLLISSALLLSQVVDGLSVRPRRDILEAGKTIALQGVAKLKEALDHGVNVKSEGKRSIDLFGFKFGGGTNVNAGFGDAANEGASEGDDELVRRRRAVDVLGAARAISLLPQTPFGTNVNIVKVSSVSNVNNFEQPAAIPAAGTTVAAPAARRKRSHNMLELGIFEKKSFKAESELTPDNKMRMHESLEMVRGGSRVLVKESDARNKRSPQSSDEPDEENTSGGPPKGPPRGGPRGGHGPRGPCRGGPPPDGSESTTMTTAERRKRDTIELLQADSRNKRSPKGPKDGASCRGGGGQSTPAPAGDAKRRKRATSASEDSDYSEHSASEESSEMRSQRKRRQALGGGEISGKVGSWFEQLAGVFVDTVKKVVDVTKKSFGRGQAQP